MSAVLARGLDEVRPLSWLSILRLGLVQAAIGAIVVLTTVTLNRVMVVELALPATLPGALVALHYAIQILRPRLGFGADRGGRASPLIIGGMAILAVGGFAAASATVLMATHLIAGIVAAILAFACVGVGVGTAGTSVLVLMTKQVAENRRAPAATAVWLMMIFGIALTAGIAGALLRHFSMGVLLRTAAEVSGVAFVVATAAIWGIEARGTASAPAPSTHAPFLPALREIWAEPRAKKFTIFVFISMLAYSAQELILEPFAGNVLALTPGQTASLTGLQHSGVLAGMLAVAILGGRFGFGAQAMRRWTMGGCAGSAAALLGLAAAGMIGPAWPLKLNVVILGAANGAFAVAAIGTMIGLAAEGKSNREGVRMGLFGAAQALAFGAGGLLATSASDLARAAFGTPGAAYAAVFIAQAGLFLLAANRASGLFDRRPLPSMGRARVGAPLHNASVPTT